MNPLVQLSAWVRSVAAKFLRPTQTAGDIDDELLAHIQCRADDLERSGLSRTEAERRARIEFGGYQKFRVETHEAIGAQFLETFLADLRFALRVLRKSPGFTFAAIATLTLAIGANAVVFGLMDGLILRPLNVPHAENLYGTEYGIDAGLQSYPNYLDLRARNHSFEDLAAFKMVFTGMDTGGDPQSANGYAVTGNYFSVLRLQPFLGRFFDQSDERGPNSAPYIVLTHAYWHVRFHDNPGVIGRVVQLDKQPFTIIGVAPSGFHGTLMFVSPDYFMPIVNQARSMTAISCTTAAASRPSLKPWATSNPASRRSRPPPTSMPSARGSQRPTPKNAARNTSSWAAPASPPSVLPRRNSSADSCSSPA